MQICSIIPSYVPCLYIGKYRSKDIRLLSLIKSIRRTGVGVCTSPTHVHTTPTPATDAPPHNVTANTTYSSTHAHTSSSQHSTDWKAVTFDERRLLMGDADGDGVSGATTYICPMTTALTTTPTPLSIPDIWVNLRADIGDRHGGWL